MSTQVNTSSRAPTTVIATSEDAILNTNNGQIHVFSSTDPATPGESHTITLPGDPQIGERHLIVAVSAGAKLDGNDFPIVRCGAVDPLAVEVGSAVDLVFSKDPDIQSDCDCNGNSNGNGNGAGVWIAVGCCC